jgi:transcriptional regulator with XRE-family HTH domain
LRFDNSLAYAQYIAQPLDFHMSVLEHVADNLKRLRQASKLSQQTLAANSGVSRRMLVAIESGDANVSLNTLDRLAEALGVKFADLLQTPDGGSHRRIDAIAWQGRHPESVGVLMASQAATKEVEFWHWTLMPAERYTAPPDPPGWHEMFYVIEGCLILELSTGEHRIEVGDYFVFPSDCDYAYRNDGQTPLRFIRNVVH